MEPDELVSLAAFICTWHKERLRIRLTEVPLWIYRKIFFAFRFEIAPLFQYILKATPVLLTFWKQFTLWIMIFDSFDFLNFSYFNNLFKSLYQTLFWTSLQTFELAVERQAPHRRFEVPTPEVNNWKTEHLFENWFLKWKKFCLSLIYLKRWNVKKGISDSRIKEMFCLWNLESREILFVESGKQFKESGIPVTIGIQNPSSTIKDWNTVPGICGVESRIQERLRFPGARRFIDKVRRKRRLKLGGLGRGHLCYREARSRYYPSSI